LRLAVQASRGRGTKAKGSSQVQRHSLRLVRPEDAQASRPVSRLSRASDRLATRVPGRWVRKATADASSSVVASRSAVSRLRVTQ
jgi:hypothetical protein